MLYYLCPACLRALYKKHLNEEKVILTCNLATKGKPGYSDLKASFLANASPGGGLIVF